MSHPTPSRTALVLGLGLGLAAIAAARPLPTPGTGPAVPPVQEAGPDPAPRRPGAGAPAPDPGPLPALTIRAERPDLQLRAFLALFEGARAPHPAAAVARWRQATGRDDVLSKPWQAALAALNPEMVRELAVADGARYLLWLEPDGSIRWCLTVPHDDGILDALATALALTDGGAEAVLDGAAVDRLAAGPDSLRLARRGDSAVLARSRAELTRGLAHLAHPDPPGAAADPPATGWDLHLDPAALEPATSESLRTAGRLLRALGLAALDARLGLEGDRVALVARGTSETRARTGADAAAPEPPGARIAPAWLDTLPPADDRTALQGSLALEPGGATLDRLFAAADALVRREAVRTNAPTPRVRLNLLAALAGVRPEVDLWPRLVGLSGSVQTDADGALAGVWLVLHGREPADAEALADQTLPRLARAARLDRPEGPPERSLSITRRDRDVILRWGRTPDPGRVAPGPAPLAEFLAAGPIRRLIAVWPDRLPGLRPPPGTPLAAALAGAPPWVWSGQTAAGGSIDRLEWPGLRGTIARLLDALPQAIPDPGTPRRP